MDSLRSLLLALLICYNYTDGFEIGSIAFVNISRAKLSVKLYPKAPELAAHFDGTFAKVVGQTINSHNHSKWIIQSLHNASIRLKIKEQHLSSRSEISIHDASYLTDLETYSLLSSLTESKNEYSMHFGIMFQNPELTNKSCFLSSMTLIDINATLDTIMDKFYTIVYSQPRPLNVVISNQRKTINISELNDRVNKFATSSIVCHPTIGRVNHSNFKRNIEIHYIPETMQFNLKEYTLWRKFALQTEDKFIVLGSDSHSSDDNEQIISSEFFQYDFAIGQAKEANEILRGAKSANYSMLAIKKIFHINSNWMSPVYKRLIKTSSLRDSVRILQSLHNLSWVQSSKVSKIFHKLCSQCESSGEYFQAILVDLCRFEAQMLAIESELLTIDAGIKAVITKEIIQMIISKFKIYAKVNKFRHLMWALMAREIIAKYNAHFGQCETLHLVVYYARNAEFMRMERMISKSIAKSSMIIDWYEI